MKKLLILFSVTLLCFGCASKSPQNDKVATPSACDEDDGLCSIKKGPQDMSGYTLLDQKDHVFENMTMQQAIDLIQNKGSGILYIGFPDCVWCQEAVPIMNTAAKKNNLKIKYVNKRDKSSTTESIQMMEKILDPILKSNEEGKKVLYVPEVLVIQNGEIIAHHLGTFEEHDAHKRKMTEEENQKLLDIYMNMFQKLKK